MSYHTDSEALYVSAEYVLLIVTSTGEVMGGECSAQVTKGTNTITGGGTFKVLHCTCNLSLGVH